MIEDWKLIDKEMSDLYFCIKREVWAYVALLGLLLVHLGIILGILAFEDVLKSTINTYICVLGIILIILGLIMLIFSVYMRNQQRKGMRLLSQNKHHKRNFRPSYNLQTKTTSEINKKCFTPIPVRHSNKAKVSPWFSESSGPMPDLSSHRNIEEWLEQHRRKSLQNITSSSTPLSSLV